METLIKDIQDIMEDTIDVILKAESAKRDVETGINTNHTREYEEVTKQQKIESLFYYLVEAKEGMGEVKDMIKGVQEKLDKLIDVVEYEAGAVGGDTLDHARDGGGYFTSGPNHREDGPAVEVGID